MDSLTEEVQVAKREFKGRPRNEGETTTIKDPLLGGYHISVTEDCYILLDGRKLLKPKPIGYFTTLGGVLNKLVKIFVDNKSKSYTLKEYINEYKAQVEILNNQFL